MSKLGRVGRLITGRRELDFHELFVKHYDTIRGFREGADSPGVALLAINSPDGEITIVVGERALREVVLVGRYRRCDTGRLPVLANCHISRVHVLVIDIAGRLYAIDTASKNGLWLGETEVKVYPLTFHQKLMLGRNCASMEWLPIH